jgi:hypothetical protein
LVGLLSSTLFPKIPIQGLRVKFDGKLVEATTGAKVNFK